MLNKIDKVIVLTVLIATLLVGLLSVYRATLNTADLTAVSGKVIDKKISFLYTRSGRHYYLAFKLANRTDRIAINLGTKSQADEDSAFYLIDTGKIYKFYLDPTVPTQNGINWGIDKIDYNHNEVYKTSNKLKLYGGILISLLSLAVIITLKFKKQGNGSQHWFGKKLADGSY